MIDHWQYALVALIAGTMHDELWAQRWTQRTGPGPAPRYVNGAMAYDAARGEVVLFGGAGQPRVPNAETWVWRNGSWTQRTPATSPSPRYLAAMAYDAQRQEVVLFGGSTGQADLGDTWTWDGSTWTPKASSGPAARDAHAMAYDPIRQVVVLFGGEPDSESVAEDTWVWDGSQWAQRCAVVCGPGPRKSVGMAFDAVRRTVLVWGGERSNGTVLGDMWEWNGAVWSAVSQGNAPLARTNLGLATLGTSRVLLFGGRDAAHTIAYGDTWIWDGTGWSQQLAAPSPPGRQAQGLAPTGDCGAVLFGGFVLDPSSQVLGDTWEFAGMAATYNVFGTGCPSSSGQVPVLSPMSGSLPRLGSTLTVDIAPLPNPLPGVQPVGLLGFSKTVWTGIPLPLPLCMLGRCDCTLLVSIEAYRGLPACASGSTSCATWSLGIPLDCRLIGASFYQQCLMLDLLASSLVVSNAGCGTIGS